MSSETPESVVSPDSAKSPSAPAPTSGEMSPVEDEEGTLPRAIIANDRPRVWYQVSGVSRRITPRDELTKFHLMSRPVVLLRRGVDAVVLPRNQIVREFFDFCCEHLGVQKKQVRVHESSRP